jgi:polyhydroxyalkanoate synthesis regulator phasin
MRWLGFFFLNQKLGETMEEEAKVPEEGEAPKAPDPVEELAKEIGWNPDFDGENAVDAKTYILRSRDIQSSLNKKVTNLSRELSAVKEGVEVVKWSAEQSRQKEIDRLKAEVSDLKARRREAIKDGDADTVEAIDGKIKVSEKAMQSEPAPKPATGPPPEYFDWLEKNQWYSKDPEMTRYADELLKLPEYKAVGAASYPRLLKKVEKAVKSEFAENFPTEKKPDPAPAVSGTSQRASKTGKQKSSAKDLSFDQKKIGKEFVAMGIYKDLDEYAANLQEKNK